MGAAHSAQALGVIFVWHGYDKVFTAGMPMVAGFLGSIGVPISGLMAYILAYGEIIGGLLLIIGLFTHWAAKFAVIVGIVAFFAVHFKNGFAIGNGGYEYIMLIFAAAVSVLITGAGKYSLDAMWMKKNQGATM
ncbi:MAG: DoxX family protein [Patescibacteria group bacterium]